MNLRPTVLLAVWLVGVTLPWGRSADAAPPVAASVQGLSMDPSTADVPMGKARLSVEPLTRTTGKDGLGAAYKVDISPWAFKSEAGRFSVAISGDDLRRLADGTAIHFTGQAASQDGGNTSAVRGRASPVANSDGGELRLEIEGKKGKLIFHTVYHLIH